MLTLLLPVIALTPSVMLFVHNNQESAYKMHILFNNPPSKPNHHLCRQLPTTRARWRIAAETFDALKQTSAVTAANAFQFFLSFPSVRHLSVHFTQYKRAATTRHMFIGGR